MNSVHRAFIRKENVWDVDEASKRFGVSQATIKADDSPTTRAMEEAEIFSFIESQTSCIPSIIIDYCIKRRILGMTSRSNYAARYTYARRLLKKKLRFDQMLQRLIRLGVKVPHTDQVYATTDTSYVHNEELEYDIELYQLMKSIPDDSEEVKTASLGIDIPDSLGMKTPDYQTNEVIEIDTTSDDGVDKVFGTTSCDSSVIVTYKEVNFTETPCEINVSVQGCDLKCLQGNGWLNDVIISYYIRSHIKPTAGIFVFHCQLFANLYLSRQRTDSDISWYQVACGLTRWLDWTSLQSVIIPVCLKNHWSLIIVRNPSGQAHLEFPVCIHTDSIPGYHDTSELADIIMRYMVLEMKAKYGRCIKYSVAVKPTDPPQRNGYDCGLFMLHYAKAFAEESSYHVSVDVVAPNGFTEECATKLRAEILASISASSFTT